MKNAKKRVERCHSCVLLRYKTELKSEKNDRYLRINAFEMKSIVALFWSKLHS